MGVLLVDLLVVNRALFVSAGDADLECLLSALIRFTSHGSFVGGQLVAADHQAIDGDDHTSDEMHDVADMQMVHMELLFTGNAIIIWPSYSNLKFK